MPKPNIFLKIYLCFLFVTMLVSVTQFNLDRLIGFRPPSFHLRHTLETVLAGYGPIVLEHHVRGDRGALKSLTDKLQNSTGITVYLIDTMGKNTGNDPLPQDVAVAVEHVRHSKNPEFSFADNKALLARSLAADDGARYFLAGTMREPSGSFDPPRPGPFFMGVFGLPPPPGRDPWFLVFRFLIVLVISGGVCYWLARYLTSPVVKLQEATRRFAGGEMSVRIGRGIGNRKDEFTGLAEDFDRMAERIGTLMAQQRQLLRDISHELRSPLTRLNVAVELARRQGGTKITTILDRIEAEAELLNDMIGQVLTLARFDSDAEAIQMAPVDLTALVQEITADANFEAQARKCTVQVVASTGCTVLGNEGLLRHAIENVIRNAVVHTRQNTVVEVQLARAGGNGTSYAEITVRDHGQGVPEADLPHLFDPFYRVSDARERQTGGTGLGLAITKHAVNLHQGTVTALNTPEGGLVAVIRLPVKDRDEIGSSS